MTIVSGTQLKIIEEACEAILTFTEDVEPDDFFKSKITQREVTRQITIICETCENLAYDLKVKMAEIDWAGWNILLVQRKSTGGYERDALWFAVRSLVPATIMWLRVFKKNMPEMFSITA